MISRLVVQGYLYTSNWLASQDRQVVGYLRPRQQQTPSFTSVTRKAHAVRLSEVMEHQDVVEVALNQLESVAEKKIKSAPLSVRIAVNVVKSLRPQFLRDSIKDLLPVMVPPLDVHVKRSIEAGLPIEEYFSLNQVEIAGDLMQTLDRLMIDGESSDDSRWVDLYHKVRSEISGLAENSIDDFAAIVVKSSQQLEAKRSGRSS